MRTPLGKGHTLAWFGLGFRALVRVFGLFQTFSRAHYSKLFLIDKIVSSLGREIPDIGRYEMGCLQSPTYFCLFVFLFHLDVLSLNENKPLESKT